MIKNSSFQDKLTKVFNLMIKDIKADQAITAVFSEDDVSRVRQILKNVFYEQLYEIDKINYSPLKG